MHIKPWFLTPPIYLPAWSLKAWWPSRLGGGEYYIGVPSPFYLGDPRHFFYNLCLQLIRDCYRTSSIKKLLAWSYFPTNPTNHFLSVKLRLLNLMLRMRQNALQLTNIWSFLFENRVSIRSKTRYEMVHCELVGRKKQLRPGSTVFFLHMRGSSPGLSRST